MLRPVSFRVLKAIQECPADSEQYKRSHDRAKECEPQRIETSSRPFRIENGTGDRGEDTDSDNRDGNSIEPERTQLTLFIASCRFEIHPLEPGFSKAYIWWLPADKT